MHCWIAAVSIFAAAEASIQASSRIEDIVRDWRSSGLRRLEVASATASSHFGDSAKYGPSRAVDQQVGTKWVAADQPSQEEPQWLRLDLFGTQQVCAVAVFGEAVDNDGIQDAQVQVGEVQSGEFRTVAATLGETSASWLATFEPVETTVVRLWVTRSGGPSTHTDVYEVEVYGSLLSPEQLKNYALERLEGIMSRWHAFGGELERTGLRRDSGGPVDRWTEDMDRQRRRLEDQVSRWTLLSETDREVLVTQLERLEVRLKRTTEGLSDTQFLWPKRSEEIVACRERLRQESLGPRVLSSEDGGMLRLCNEYVNVMLHEEDGSWAATWLGEMNAALRGVRFQVEMEEEEWRSNRVESEVTPFQDPIGAGLVSRQTWGSEVKVQREIRVYHGKGILVVSGEVTNESDRKISLRSAHILDISQETSGWWLLGDALSAPAAVGYPGASPACRPAPEEEAMPGTQTHYGSAGVLSLCPGTNKGGLTVGFLSAQSGAPSLAGAFKTFEGGTDFSAVLSLGGCALEPGQTLSLDPVYLSVEDNPFGGLEKYGDAVVSMTSKPIRTAANALWCSWYPLRMTINEEIVLEHARIASQHFRPLGLEIIQLDHGWQRGNICGDWEPNERFPHGLQWLSEQLQTQFGMKLGLWIAPTQVASTSQLSIDHPEWMAQGEGGHPAVTGRWFWEPNPDMYTLNAGYPLAEKWLEETFGRLSSEGAAYYKIDFIAGSPSLGRAMAAIRRGAGQDAWIRYCQTPPLLSVGLASSAYIGDDTGDAGLDDWMRLERLNAPLLAASYWVNDRLYRREVCDMSVGKGAGVEEARFKLTMMTMAGCSISFSDDFRQLELPRIRMMQQCLPPGNPLSRPLDLYERERPSLWHMHCQRESRSWDAVGVFNFEDEPQERTVDLSLFALPAEAEVLAFEFWEEKLLGTYRDAVTLLLPPRSARILLIHRLPKSPKVIATNMHVLGGYHELKEETWDAHHLILSGQVQRAPGLEGKIYIYVPYGFRPRVGASNKNENGSLSLLSKNLCMHEVHFKRREMRWEIAFDLSEQDLQ